jgi:hypothetical protein
MNFKGIRPLYSQSNIQLLMGLKAGGFRHNVNNEVFRYSYIRNFRHCLETPN